MTVVSGEAQEDELLGETPGQPAAFYYGTRMEGRRKGSRAPEAQTTPMYEPVEMVDMGDKTGEDAYMADGEERKQRRRHPRMPRSRPNFPPILAVGPEDPHFTAFMAEVGSGLRTTGGF